MKQVLLTMVLALLVGCEAQNAIARHIDCDGKRLGTTVVPEGSLGYGPHIVTTQYGWLRMSYRDIETGTQKLIDVSHCKVLEINEELVGKWRDYRR